MPAPKKRTSIATFSVGNVTVSATVLGTRVTDDNITQAKFGYEELGKALKAVKPFDNTENDAE